MGRANQVITEELFAVEMWVIKEGFEALVGVILLCQRSCMAELPAGKRFEACGKDWFSLQARREAVGSGKPYGEPSQ